MRNVLHFLFQNYRQAIALSPEMINAHMNLAVLLHIRVSKALILKICFILQHTNSTLSIVLETIGERYCALVTVCCVGSMHMCGFSV